MMPFSPPNVHRPDCSISLLYAENFGVESTCPFFGRAMFGVLAVHKGFNKVII